MRIRECIWSLGRDFSALLECEHCGGTQELKTGYNDAYYHEQRIPAITCRSCGKNRAGEIPAAPIACIRTALAKARGEVGDE